MFKPAPKKEIVYEALPPNVHVDVHIPEQSKNDGEKVALWCVRIATLLGVIYLVLKPVVDRLIH